MIELDFKVLAAQSAQYAATPTLLFKLAIQQRGLSIPIQSISLQCQVRIDTKQRIYRPEEQERLTDLFGESHRWSQTLQNMLWTLASVNVHAFEKEIEVDLPVACTFDFNIAATKYFHGLIDGEAPLQLLFSGSVFYRDEEGNLAMDLVSWNEEARYRLPVIVWQEMMELYYPNRNWLCVNRQIFDALYEYKRRNGYLGFEEAITSLLPDATKAAS